VNLQEFAARFSGARESGGRYSFQCPVHDDTVNSVSASVDENRILVHCHAGCATNDILSSVGMSMNDLFSDPPSTPPVPMLKSSSTENVYTYTDLDGTVLHEVVRGKGKTFRQRRPKPDGGWEWKTSGHRVPFRWPELVGNDEVYIVEGEKDALRLCELGVPATCNLGGAGKWREEESEKLKEIAPRVVYVIPDNDLPGQKHAVSVVEHLTKVGLEARIVPLPGLDKHGDVSAWLDKGHTAADLITLSHTPPALVSSSAIPPEVMQSDQIFTRVGEGLYRLEYPGLGITLEASQLHRDRGRELHGELTVTTTIEGAKTVDGVLLWSSLNFSSQRTRASTASSLAGRSGPSGSTLDWVGAVETLALRVARAEGKGSVIQPLADYPLPSPESQWDVSGLPILQRHPMILFGDGGSAKSYLALHIASTLAGRGIKVLFADWEFSPEDHRERLERLNGPSMPRDTLHYVRCAGPLVAEMARLQKHIVTHQIQYIVCDSIAFAVPGRPEDAENASAYFRAVRYLGIGSLHLAHTTKSHEHGEDKPFGSVFWSNGARSVWLVKRNGDQGDGSNVVEVALSHKKSNTGRRLSTFGLRLSFSPDRTRVDRFDVADSVDLAGSLPLWQRVKSLVSTRPMTVDEIGRELSAKPDSVRKVVQRMDMFVRGEDDKISLGTTLHSGRF